MVIRMPQILEKLFGSTYRPKCIRLFLLNPERILSFRDVAHRTKVRGAALRRELAALQSAALVKRGVKIEETAKTGAGKKNNLRRKRIEGWMLDRSFPLFAELKLLMLNAAPVSKPSLLRRIRRLGRIKLVTLGGIFLQEDTRLDLLVVGDGIKKGTFERLMRDVEAEVGKELVYACLSTEEFTYRLGMYDRFVRDVLEAPHEHLLNKLGV